MQFMLSRLSKGDTVLDIGANRGLFSYWMAKSVGPEGRVLSFEPQPEMQEQLSLMRKRFGFHSVELIQKGLSDKPGVLTMARPENNWGGASFENRTHQCAMENFDVEVICLDDFIRENEVSGVTFVKCDVEGHEEKVFRGGERFLREQRPALLFECDDAEDPECSVFAYLKTIGYRGYCFHEGLSPIEDYGRLLPNLNPKALKDFVFLPDS